MNKKLFILFAFALIGIFVAMHSVSATYVWVQNAGVYQQLSPTDMTSNTAPTPYTASSSPTSTNAYTAFTASTTTNSLSAATYYIQLDFSSAIGDGLYPIIDNVTWQIGNAGTGSQDRAPSSITISGSNDGTTWTNLTTQAGVEDLNPHTFTFTNSNQYRYYRFWGSPYNGNLATIPQIGFKSDYYKTNVGATLISPDNNSVQSGNVTFNVSIINSGQTVNNVTLFVNGSQQYFNNSGLNGTYLYTNSSMPDGYWSYFFQTYLNNVAQNSSTYYFTVDTIPPTINITNPSPNNTLINYQLKNTNLQFNWTATDPHLSACWVEYGGSNHSVSCSANTTNINITSPSVNNATFYANDTAGNLASLERSWGYKVFQNSQTYNSTTYQTAYEGYDLNLTANSSLTGVNLIYDGISHAMTNTSGLWNYANDINASASGSKNFYYQFTYGGNTFNSGNYTQTITAINFQLCGGGYTTTFLNVSFKNETQLASINASIPYSEFTYYLGTGTQNKTYTYSSTSVNYNYSFCASPIGRTFHVIPYLQYKQGTTYPQRIWNPDTTNYTNSTTQQTLYLLNAANGIYVTFQTINSAEQGIEGVVTTVTREISGSTVQIGKDTTGAGGGVTFWLNPDFTHTVTFEKSGYDTYTISLTPTQSTYTITLSGSPPSTTNYYQGISYSIQPSGDFILKNASYNFNYTITSNYYNLDSFGFSLFYPNGTEIGNQSSTGNSGGTVGLDFNVTNESRIIMNYYYEINGTFVNGTRYWISYSSNDFSIARLFSDISTAINTNNVFGILSNDNGYFAKALISVLVLIIGAGLLSMRYGLISEPAVMGIIFGLSLLLNNLGFFPSISNFPTTGHTLEVGTLITIITAIMTIGFIFREETY